MVPTAPHSIRPQYGPHPAPSGRILRRILPGFTTVAGKPRA